MAPAAGPIRSRITRTSRTSWTSRRAMSVGSRDLRRARRAEKDLVRRMIAGDERAFEEFCDDYIPMVLRFAQRRLDGNRELAREMVQSTVCKVIANLGSFRGEAALSTWLCACCRNEIAGHFRRPVREVELKEELLSSQPALDLMLPDGPERTLLRKESADLVHIALDALPPRYGKALEWKYLENLSVKEIARRLGLGPKAAESLLTRARNAFRDGYAQLAESVKTSAGSLEMGLRRTAVKS